MKEGSRGGSSPSPRRRPTPFEREFPAGSESANACVISLVRAYEAWTAAVNQALAELQLSPAGREALAVLEGAGGVLSPTTIAERLLVTTASVTSLLDTLQRRGLVTRSPDPDDRRKVVVTLTDEGQALVDQFLPKVVAVQTALMAELTETQRVRLLAALTTVTETASTLDPSAVAAAAPPRGRAPRR